MNNFHIVLHKCYIIYFDCLFVIGALTVTDACFFVDDSQDEKRERRSKKQRERNEFIESK
jgi:hypothetical protein